MKMNLTALTAVAYLLTTYVYADSYTESSTKPSTDHRQNGNSNSENNRNGHNNESKFLLQPRQKLRHLLEANTECVLYLKEIEYKDGDSDEKWSCEIPPELAEQFGGIVMMDIQGIGTEELDTNGAISGESIIRLDASAYIEQPVESRHMFLQIPQASDYTVERMDSKIDLRHARNRRARLRRQRNLESGLAGSLGTLKILVVRILDGTGTGPDADAKQLQNDIFNDNVSLKSQYEACSYDQVLITQAPEYSTTMANNEEVSGIIDLNVNSKAKNGNFETIGDEAVAVLIENNGRSLSAGENFDLVIFCLPPGTGDWVAYAYINDWRSFYNNEWCGRVSAQMHEVGHNLNLGHSGLPGNFENSDYADKSGMMGFSYELDDGPIQCFNPAKSYQLGWYPKQTLSIDPLDYVNDPQDFTLNGISDYQSDGSNGDALVSLRLEHEGLEGGIDYYIGYNRAKGVNSGTVQVPNLVTVTEKTNPDYDYKGRDGYGLSTRIAGLKKGESITLRNYAGTPNDVTLEVNSIFGKKAKITITTTESIPSLAPTTIGYDNFQIELRTDSFGDQTRWSIREKETKKSVLSSSQRYSDNETYLLPSPTSYYSVAPGKCYIFVITDGNGDGICCFLGLGYYKGFLDGIEIFEGSEFWDRDEKEFCVPSSDDDQSLGTFPLSKLPTDALTVKPTSLNLPIEYIPTKEPSLYVPSTSPTTISSASPVRKEKAKKKKKRKKKKKKKKKTQKPNIFAYQQAF